MTLLPNILLILAALFVGAAVIAAVVSWRAGREARSTLFPIVREEETLRARRSRVAVFFLGALAALFLGGWLATLNLAGFEQLPAADTAHVTPTELSPVALATEVPASTLDTPSPAVPPPAETQVVSAPVSTSSPSATLPEPTFTPVAVVAVTPTSTATPTPTATPTSTATPTPTSVFAAAIALASKTRTPAPPGVQMGPIEFGTGVTDQVEAVNPSTVFSQDARSIYATFPYSGMKKDLDFKAVWYQNGVEVMRDETKWQWGDKARSYSFLNTRGAGLYKLELYVNDSVLATGMFEIR